MPTFTTQSVATATSLRLLIGGLFNLLAVFDFIDKNLGRFEAGNKVLLDHKGGISGNIPCDFALALFIDEAAKATDIDIVAVRHGILHYTEKSFYRCGNVSFVHPGLLRDFVDYICFSHFVYF